MARKRGGLAGFYDRNKGAIQAVAPFVAGAVGGPLAGAAIGAAMRGLDREGKGGIGFDFGQGIQGGISGYGAGALGAGAKSMFTGKLAERAAAKAAERGFQTATNTLSKMPTELISNAQIAQAASGAAPSAAAAAAPTGGFNAASYLADSAAQGPSRAMQIGKGVSTKNPTAPTAAKVPFYKTKEGLEFIGKGMTAGSTILGQQATAAQAEREYEDQQRQLQNRAELMALFAPQMAGNLGVQLGGGVPMGSFSQFADNAAMLATDDPRIRYLEDYRAKTNPVYGNTRTAPMTGAEYMESYGGTPAAQQLSANALAAGRDYMTTGFGGSDRARQLAEEAAARGRAYTYGRR
jgi:hypothetical protein